MTCVTRRCDVAQLCHENPLSGARQPRRCFEETERRSFTCAATIDGEQVGLGTGQSKKAAEQEAARQALEGLGVDAETEAFSPS